MGEHTDSTVCVYVSVQSVCQLKWVGPCKQWIGQAWSPLALRANKGHVDDFFNLHNSPNKQKVTSRENHKESLLRRNRVRIDRRMGDKLLSACFSTQFLLKAVIKTHVVCSLLLNHLRPVTYSCYCSTHRGRAGA